jgi:hypothetical protein
MDNEKKKGILLIVIGICIPLFALPFVSGFDMSKGFMHNFYNTGIRIMKDTGQPVPAASNPASDSSQGPAALKIRIDKIPYRFFFAPTILLIYIGIVLIEKARKKLPDQKS